MLFFFLTGGQKREVMLLAVDRTRARALNQLKNALDMFRLDHINAPENLLQRHIGELFKQYI